MMYYIEKPQTWSPANKKCAEIQKFVAQYENCLVADDGSRDALIKEIRHKVDELNAAYPRTKKLRVDFAFDNYISCTPVEDRTGDEYVFAFHFYPVKRTYDVVMKGGEK